MLQISKEQRMEKVKRMTKIYLNCQKAVSKVFEKENLNEESRSKLTTTLFIHMNQQLKGTESADYEYPTETMHMIYQMLQEELNKENRDELIGGTIAVFIQFGREYR